jgi:mRNA interferase MazF
MQAQVLKWGNSLAVRIPKPVAEDAHLQVGDPLEIAVRRRWGCRDAPGGRDPNPGPTGGPNHPGESLCGDFSRAGDRTGSRRMVSRYVPDTGDIVFLDFDPQVGREQAKRRPALVLTDLRYNRASGLAVVCPLTSKIKPYPFTLPIAVGDVEGAVLVDQMKSMDWQGRGAEFHSKAPAILVAKVRQYIAVLLQISIR